MKEVEIDAPIAACGEAVSSKARGPDVITSMLGLANVPLSLARDAQAGDKSAYCKSSSRLHCPDTQRKGDKDGFGKAVLRTLCNRQLTSFAVELDLVT